MPTTFINILQGLRMNWLKQIAQSQSQSKTTTRTPSSYSGSSNPPGGQRVQPGYANAAYAARLQALADYYRQRSARGVAAVRLLDQPPKLSAYAPYQTATRFSRLPPGSPIAMSLDEYMRRVNARRLYGMPVFMPTQQEWILRQNAAPPGYVWTPYAGWVLASTFADQSGANIKPPAGGGTTTWNDYNQGGGSGGGGAAPASLPSWIENFLNQVTWRI